MSYILEALKKAERKRELQERPKSVAFSAEASKPARKQRIWLYVLVAVLVANAILLVRWSSEGPANKEAAQPVPPPSPAVHHSDIQPAPPPHGVPSKKEESSPLRTAAPAQETEKKKAETLIEKPQSKPIASEREGREMLAPAAKPAVSEVAVAKETTAPQERRHSPTPGKLYGLGELPPEIRNALPAEFRISGHAYSAEARTRVVRINEKILQEGQELSAGLKLDEITLNGVIFIYQGFRFRLGINQSR